MAKSKCPSCDSTSFEFAEMQPKHATYTLHFVQCASCGAVVGALDYYNIGKLIHKLARGLNIKLD